MIVYLVWGSTFVAMRAAVSDSSFGPFSVGASRLAVASVVLFALASLRKMPLRVKRGDLPRLAASGLLIWVGGNGLVMWSEQWVDAGYATLVFSTLPIWTTLIGCAIDRTAPSMQLIASFVSAFFGMALLGGESLLTGNQKVLVPTLVILLSAILWSISTHLQKRKPVSCSMFVASAYQQLFGAFGFAAMALLFGEHWPHPSVQAWWAWAYLVVFGSIIAYSSYLHVVREFSPSVAMTFAYVCPVLTIVFGRLILNEEITWNKVTGMVVILLAVFGIFRDQHRIRMRAKHAQA